jgi:hypothetical protein
VNNEPPDLLQLSNEKSDKQELTDLMIADFFATHERFFKTSNVATTLPDGRRSPRLNQRYKAIIAQNRPLFRDARVLDIASHDGRWTMAALDAGARHVVGVEGRMHLIENAYQSFVHYGIEPDRYSIINGDVFDALPKFNPGEFDLIMCLGFFYHTTRHYEMFQHFYRIGARHMILDTEVAPGAGAFVLFRREDHQLNAATLQTTKGIEHSITGTPSHEMITLLCEHFRFRYRLIDWNNLGITD